VPMYHPHPDLHTCRNSSSPQSEHVLEAPERIVSPFIMGTL